MGLNSLGPVHASTSAAGDVIQSFLRNIEICGKCIGLANVILLPSGAAASVPQYVSPYMSDDNAAEYLCDYFLEAG